MLSNLLAAQRCSQCVLAHVALLPSPFTSQQRFEFDKEISDILSTPDALQLQIKRAYLIDEPAHPRACRQHEQNIGKQQEISLFFLLPGQEWRLGQSEALPCSKPNLLAV